MISTVSLILYSIYKYYNSLNKNRKVFWKENMHKISNNERINRSWESREIEQKNSVSSVILHVKSCDFAVITINQRRLTNKHTLRDDKFYKWYQKISGNVRHIAPLYYINMIAVVLGA